MPLHDYGPRPNSWQYLCKICHNLRYILGAKIRILQLRRCWVPYRTAGCSTVTHGCRQRLIWGNILCVYVIPCACCYLWGCLTLTDLMQLEFRSCSRATTGRRMWETAEWDTCRLVVEFVCYKTVTSDRQQPDVLYIARALCGDGAGHVAAAAWCRYGIAGRHARLADGLRLTYWLIVVLGGGVLIERITDRLSTTGNNLKNIPELIDDCQLKIDRIGLHSYFTPNTIPLFFMARIRAIAQRFLYPEQQC